ncbi:telomere repeats-binding bouquet formation protein 2 [Spinachia spinachia]
MFANKSAWFSSSVAKSCHTFWRVEGGAVAGWRKADYLFSEDAACADTLRIFESEVYLWNKVVIFHSWFLSACEVRRSVRSVCIGHYVLPPASVQQEVRHVVGRLIWECEDEQGFRQRFSMDTENEHSEVGKSDSEQSDDTDLSDSEAPLRAQYPVSNTLSGYVSIEKLQKYSGDLCEFQPGCFRCSNCKNHC